MNKKTILLIILSMIVFISCNQKFDEVKFGENFKDLHFEFTSNESLSDSAYCETYFINKDFSFSKQVDYCNEPYKFQIGKWSSKNDSTTFEPISIDNYNFFLDYNLKASNHNPDYGYIKIFDKTGKICNEVLINLIKENSNYEMKTTKGKIKIKSNEFDSISFPILEKLTNRKHRFKMPKKFSSLEIVLDINSQIFEKKDIEYYISKEKFILFTSVENFFNE